MRSKIYAMAISAIFLFLLVWCPVSYALDIFDVAKLPENKNIKLPAKVYEEDAPFAFLMNTIEQSKAALENIYSNALPAYEQITIFMSDNDRSMRRYFLDVLYGFEKAEPDGAVVMEQNPAPPLENIGGDAEIATEQKKPEVKYRAEYIGTDWCNDVWAFTEEGKPFSEGWTDKTLLAGEPELRWRVETQLGHVNRIANANKDVNFYVYVCTRFQETEIFGEIIKDIRIMRNEFSTHDFMMQFFEGLDMSAVNAYDYFKIDTVEKRLEYICKTDHHEAAQGAYSIYCDVVNMIENDAPGIGGPREAEFDAIDGAQLRGSHVWNHGYTEIYDDWWYYIIDLPEHAMYENINGRGKTNQRNLDRYLDGKFSKDTFADHYASFYPRPGNVEYPGNKTGRNLLMLTDSYSWATGELIASNFDHMYSTLWTHGRFDYNKFIEENDITDVLILQVADRILYDIQNDTQLDKVITD
ncbi:MAG: hypothetical protein FWG34_07505 [Oscillospiraceae bacterium]|nr:hypothetical protein [Oscillospiraceae bacterium]